MGEGSRVPRSMLGGGSSPAPSQVPPSPGLMIPRSGAGGRNLNHAWADEVFAEKGCLDPTPIDPPSFANESQSHLTSEGLSASNHKEEVVDGAGLL